MNTGNMTNDEANDIGNFIESQLSNKIQNSMQLALILEEQHNEVMKLYWRLEEKIVKQRNLIKCNLVFTEDEHTFLKDMSPSFVMAAFVYFDKIKRMPLYDF